MNLQEALNYRNKCVICHREMILKSKNPDLFKIDEVEDGLKVFNYHIKYDGSYERGEHYKNPFIIKKSCPVCISEVTHNKTIILKSRSVGLTTMSNAYKQFMSPAALSTRHSEYTTLENIKKQGCFYSFCIKPDNLGKYEITLLTDNIRYCNKKEFWHLNTDFTINDEKKTVLHYARFDDNLDNIFTLYLPAVDTTNIKNKEQFIKKFKIYSLFS